MSFLRSSILTLGVAALAACSSADADVASSESMATNASAFPPGFQFGSAIAGFQVDMGCPNVPAAQCEDRNSDWYQWITTPRIVDNPLLFMSKDPPSAGPGFFETYEQDLGRAANELGSNSVRLSIEWSRIFPQPTWGISDHGDLRALASPEGLAFYHSIFRAMKARGLEPFVTVNHYSLPLWVHDGNMCNQSLDDCIRARKAGWADPDRSRITNEIAKYAGFVAQEFSAEVNRWATMNEPFSAVVLPGYLISSPMRSNPPGLSAFWMRPDGAKTAAAAMIEANAKMYDAIKANDPGSEVGIVYAFSDIVPNSDHPDDARAAEHAQYIFHDMFMDGVINGRLDENWDAGPGKAPVRADLAGKADFIGVNYYFRFRAKPGWFGFLTGGISPYLDFDPLAPFEGTPKGLEATLRRVHERYKLPLYVSETGADQADPNAGAAWMVQTMREVKDAIKSGIDVRGFYAWTLMDNYEWNHGMHMKMGLYGVDPRTKARTLRPAGQALAEMSRARDIPAALEQKYASFFP